MDFLGARFCSICPHEPGVKGFWFHLCDLAQSHLWHFLDFVLRRMVPGAHRPRLSWKCVTSASLEQLHHVTSSGGDADRCLLLPGLLGWGLNGVLGSDAPRVEVDAAPQQEVARGRAQKQLRLLRRCESISRSQQQVLALTHFSQRKLGKAARLNSC